MQDAANRQSNDHPDTGTCSKRRRRTDPISKENVQPSTSDADPSVKLSDNTSEIFAESNCDADPFAKFLNPSRIFAEPNGKYFSNTPNLFARYIDCESVDAIPSGLDQFDELASVQERHPKSRMIFDISNRLGLRDDGSPKHPVVFGGSLGALGSITSLALINFPPLTNRDQITKCHCWQKDGKLGEGCLQIIVDWAVDILVHVYDKDRDVSECLVRSCWGFVDITPIGGPGSWAYGPDTKSHYSKVAESVKEPSKAILTDLVKTLPNLESLVVFGALPFEYAIKEDWFSNHLINQPIDMCLFHPLQAKMHVMDMAQALAWANAISCSLAAAMGCAPIKITPDILMIFYLPANKDASTDEARKTNLLAGILRAGGCTDLAAGVTKMLRCQDKKSPDAAYVDYAVKGTLLLTGVSIPEKQYNPFRRCIEVVEEAIDSKMVELEDEETCDEWTEAQEEKLLEIQSVLSGCGLAWILLSLAIKSPEQCRNRARTARLNQISRRHKAGKELTEEEKDFLAKYEAARAKDNERKSELYYANKARYDEIGSKDREELTEEEKDFLAKYEADRAKANEYGREWRSSNKARSEDIARRLAAREEVTKEEKDFLAKYEADPGPKANERKLEWYYANKARYDEIGSKAREELTKEEEDFLAKY
ncbi:hypothetical protein THAOC_10408, partial [Thalassiosira oceanica]